ncbi:MAG: DNA-3-methyladenine glycosylase [Granulosicoccus sp.]
MRQLTPVTLQESLSYLSTKDELIKSLFADYGVPPLWERSQSFDTLVHIIVEQKVSMQSAHAVMQRVRNMCPDMTPSRFLAIDQSALRLAGLSDRKFSYCRAVAEAMDTGKLRLASLDNMDDEQVIEALVSVRGIGKWSAGVYLMMAMRRPDAWPSGDRALVVSYAESTGSDSVPAYAEFDLLAERWRPCRGSVARLLWHAYLERRWRS